MKLQKIGVLSAAKIQGLLMAIIGLIFGVVFFLVGSMASLLLPNGAGSSAIIGLSFLGVILLPLMYGLMGFVMGALAAFVYNVIAGFVGGLEVELQ